MSKPREWWISDEAWAKESNAEEMRIWQTKPPHGDPIHVIEAAPVLAEIASLKKQLAETKKQLDDLIAAELGG